MIVWWYVYLAGVALVLAIMVQLRRMKLEEDGPDQVPMPTAFYVAILVVAFAWPIVAGVMATLYVLNPGDTDER